MLSQLVFLAGTTLAAAVYLPDTAATYPSHSLAVRDVTYSASFTQYGAGDSFGSGNCNTATAACGFYNFPGYNAAASQNLFGVGPGEGAGPACGGCWRITPETDSSGNPVVGASEIVVKINNLCPAQGNPLCSQSSLTATNSVGKNVNFDLCKDDGAAGAFFGTSGTGLILGHVTQVDCSQWQGSEDKRS